MPQDITIMLAQSSPGATTPMSGELNGWIIFASVGVLWMLLSFIYRMFRTSARERTRREIAAYIAEGTMTPEQGERLMKAGEHGKDT